ncbi:MAG TPA: histidine kinase dimerization/phospho-acceptor domain-containing protein [Xanthomonadaceae bacterium]|nr:histidine kinase dimerization/phospho-acceptor domain-containing protein [Xanthomonadaceae bacterium]
MPPQPQATRLAESLAGDELGRLAAAVDRYQARLLEREARDRAFFADASHELRTPLAVVRGAAEVLADRVGAGELRALRRLERGIGTLEQRLHTVMLVARGASGASATIDLVHLVADLAGRTGGS